VSREARCYEQVIVSQTKSENESAKVLPPTCFLLAREGLGRDASDALDKRYLYAISLNPCFQVSNVYIRCILKIPIITRISGIELCAVSDESTICHHYSHEASL